MKAVSGNRVIRNQFFFLGGGMGGGGEQRDTYVFKAYQRNGRASRWYKIFSVIKHQIFSIRVRFLTNKDSEHVYNYIYLHRVHWITLKIVQLLV